MLINTCPTFVTCRGTSLSRSYGSWISNYLCNQCLIPLKFWVRSSLMERCTRYNIMFFSDLRQVGGFLHQYNWPSWYNWNIVENGTIHNPYPFHDKYAVVPAHRRAPNNIVFVCKSYYIGTDNSVGKYNSRYKLSVRHVSGIPLSGTLKIKRFGKPNN